MQDCGFAGKVGLVSFSTKRNRKCGRFLGKARYVGKTLDKSGGNGIIGVGRNEAAGSDIMELSSKFVQGTEKLYRYADKITPIDGFSDIICHGTPDSLLINGLSSEEWYYTAEQAAEIIKNSNEFNGEKIRLVSCQTGAKPDGIAQQIADILQVEVLAPNEIVNINSDGEIFLTDNKYLAELWDNGEDVVQTGKWVIFKPKKG